MELTIFLLVLALGSAAVIPFDNAAVDQIFQQKNAALFLFLSDQEAGASALNLKPVVVVLRIWNATYHSRDLS